jgi:hypothetical protein
VNFTRPDGIDTVAPPITGNMGGCVRDGTPAGAGVPDVDCAVVRGWRHGPPTDYVLVARHMFDELQSLGFADSSSLVVCV